MNGADHVRKLEIALGALRHDIAHIDRMGRRLGAILGRGGRLLAAGNGGSAAHAQHLTAELVGRYQHERRPLSAIALHADTSAFTAIVNDYGPDMGFARAVTAHGRPGDALVLLSTSGESPNVIAAAAAARQADMVVLALTGRGPNQLTRAADDSICVDADTPTVQEVHQVVVHLLCASIDAHIGHLDAATRTPRDAHRTRSSVVSS